MSRGLTHESSNNKSVDWYTPKWIFDAMGVRFDLDPCQPEGGLSWIPADKFYTIKDNGLTSPWTGRVWLNPPYGRDTQEWLAKMHQYRNGIALVFARTDCKWFHDYVSKSDAILFLSGRIHFVDGLQVTAGNGPGSGSMLIAWGQENVEALRKISSKGMFICPQPFNDNSQPSLL
jgi:phage N-6-adenine-methyltransferase